MWSFKTKNFTVIWEIEPDALNVSYMDRSLADECRRNIRSGKWECFATTVRVIENSSGVAMGEAFLGGSVYANPAEFRDHFGMNKKGHGSYFSDLVREAVAEARKRFPEFHERTRAEIARKQAVLGIALRDSQHKPASKRFPEFQERTRAEIARKQAVLGIALRDSQHKPAST